MEDEDLEAAREQSGRRRRRMARARQQRERELRGMYLRAGIGIALVLVLLILVLPRVLFKRAGGTPETSGTTASARSQTETTTADREKAEESETGAAAEDPETGETVEPKETDGRNTGEKVTGGAPADAWDETEAENEEKLPVITAAGNSEDKTESAEAGSGRNASGAAARENTKDTSEKNDAAEEPSHTDGVGGRNSTDTETGSEQEQGTAPAYAHQDDWRLILVNRWNPLPEGHTVETTSLINGEQVDSRCYNDLARMLSDCAAVKDCSPIVCSAYRPHEKQIALYEDQVKTELASGKNPEEAEAAAGTVVAVPGTSEHELGLAVDICASEYQSLNDAQADTPTQKWLMEHCWDYGFILRYPLDKSDITGIIYEPWHYRYVGLEAAKAMQESGQCLEEYLQD